MRRSVACRLGIEIGAPSDIVLAIAVAAPANAEESLSLTVEDANVTPHELAAEHGTRLHVIQNVEAGWLSVSYEALVTGRSPTPPVEDLDLVRYLRPSRYCESDRIAGFAEAEFRGLRDRDLLDAVSSWVGTHVAYVPGSSRPVDGAVATLLAQEGVCRDYAHLVIAFLRACGTPARMVSAYAPGLDPMDFHAVVEAHVAGQWLAVDATCLAPRSGLVRIATGRDAADTAFLSSARGPVTLTEIAVTATTESALPGDDVTMGIVLG